MAAVMPGSGGADSGGSSNSGGSDAPRDDRSFRDADRGQLLLISGLVVAVSLVSLVVLLNASIYSENVATRGIEAADGEALEVRAAAVEETGALIDGTNRAGPANRSDARDSVARGIADLDAHLAGAYADRGGVTRVESDSIREGSYVTGNLTAHGTGGSNATIAADAARVRGLVVEVDPSSLPPLNETEARADAFRVEFRNASDDSRAAYVYENDGNVTVAVGENGGDPVVRCEVSPAGSDPVAVDVTGERAGGEPCPGLWSTGPGTLAGPYDVTIENTDAADGEATATARPDSGSTVGADLDEAPAVYDATIDLRYRTADLRFETTVRVAPGEPDA